MFPRQIRKALRSPLTLVKHPHHPNAQLLLPLLVRVFKRQSSSIAPLGKKMTSISIDVAISGATCRRGVLPHLQVRLSVCPDDRDSVNISYLPLT